MRWQSRTAARLTPTSTCSDFRLPTCDLRPPTSEHAACRDHGRRIRHSILAREPRRSAEAVAGARRRAVDDSRRRSIGWEASGAAGANADRHGGAARGRRCGSSCRNLPAEPIIGEPCKRDTAPCIGLAAMLVSRDDPEATLVVMPADHVISPAGRVSRSDRARGRLVEQSPDRIVTFGIRPTYPAESFGYIERGAALGEPGCLFAVARFREKPPLAVAQEYLGGGQFLLELGHLRLEGPHDPRRPRAA